MSWFVTFIYLVYTSYNKYIYTSYKYTKYMYIYSDKRLGGATVQSTKFSEPSISAANTTRGRDFCHDLCHRWCFLHRPRLKQRCQEGQIHTHILPPPAVHVPWFCFKLRKCCAIATASKPFYVASNALFQLSGYKLHAFTPAVHTRR